MKVSQEGDLVPGRMVVIVSVVTIVIFAAGIAVAWWILSATTETGEAALPGPHEPIAKEVNAMDRWLFRERYGLEGQRAEIQRLNGYGWVDPERGIIHIPITQAMELYLNRHADAAPAQVQPQRQDLQEDMP